MCNLTPEDEKRLIDAVLCEIDDDEIAAGRPPLSVLVKHDDGAVSTAFWTTVDRHRLRQPGETDDALIARLTEAAFTYAQRAKRS